MAHTAAIMDGGTLNRRALAAELELSNRDWQLPPDTLQLQDDEVHVWRARLPMIGEPANLSAVLTGEERERAARFRFAKDRRLFVTARVTLRNILGWYLQCSPSLVRLTCKRFGKPALLDWAEKRLDFNVSHAGQMALYAITRDRQVGIDLEVLRSDFPVIETARQFFSAREVQTLEALSGEARTTAFFNCWTRKESYVKAVGEGLSRPLQSFTVSCAPGVTPSLLSDDYDRDASSQWSVFDVTPHAGYVAALAVKGEDVKVRRWEWDRACTSSD